MGVSPLIKLCSRISFLSTPKPIQRQRSEKEAVVKASPRETNPIAKQILIDRIESLAATLKQRTSEYTQTSHHLKHVIQEESEKSAGFKNKFLSRVSHKLRTPLTIIKLATEMISEKSSSKECEDLLAKQIKYTRELERLIEDVLRYSALDTDKSHSQVNRITIPVPEFLNSLTHDIAPQVRAKNLSLTISNDCRPQSHIWADEEKLNIALRHILENAIDVSPKMGIIHIGVQRDKISDFIKLDIRDQGPGISQHHMPFIFEPFYQVDEELTGQIRGLGLGLTIAKEIVEKQGGKIEFTSALGQGSCFSIYLPCGVNA